MIPSFITFADPVLTFNSPGYDKIGVFKLEIMVWDSYNSQRNPFTLTVKNEEIEIKHVNIRPNQINHNNHKTE